MRRTIIHMPFIRALLRVCAVTVVLAALVPLAHDGVGTSDVAHERAATMVMLLDSPRPRAVVDEALRVAEALRRRYGIDTGRRHADRATAARRFRAEVLDRLVFPAEELRRTAAELGYELDPARCATFCRNVERLARIELEKRALRAFAEHGALPAPQT